MRCTCSRGRRRRADRHDSADEVVRSEELRAEEAGGVERPLPIARDLGLCLSTWPTASLARRRVSAECPAPEGVVDMSLRVLYVSGNIGLGHVTRDLAIADALRARHPAIEISWLASEPALTVLRDAGEHLHPVALEYRSDSAVADRVSRDGELNLLRYAFGASRAWLSHALAVRRLLAEEKFDVVVGDETYDLLIAQLAHLLRMPVPFVMMYDFLGLDAVTHRVGERLGVYLWNLVWSLDGHVVDRPSNRAVFIGEPADIPESRFGPLLPHRREHARRHYEFVGYIVPFDAAGLQDGGRLRAELGYGPEPLVLCSVGGLGVGRELLELCSEAYPLVRESIPDVELVLVCGPSIAKDSIRAPAGVRVVGYVPQLYRHFAASDLAVVQAGGTTTLELTALRRPFVYFPVQGQCEQELVVAGRLARHRAGVRMSTATATPVDLARVIIDNLGRDVDYAPVPVDGALRVADLVLGLVSSPSGRSGGQHTATRRRRSRKDESRRGRSSAT